MLNIRWNIQWCNGGIVNIPIINYSTYITFQTQKENLRVLLEVHVYFLFFKSAHVFLWFVCFATEFSKLSLQVLKQHIFTFVSKLWTYEINLFNMKVNCIYFFKCIYILETFIGNKKIIYEACTAYKSLLSKGWQGLWMSWVLHDLHIYRSLEITLNKRPMGHIVHLRNQFKSETHMIMLIGGGGGGRINRMVLICKTLNPHHPGMLCT